MMGAREGSGVYIIQRERYSRLAECGGSLQCNSPFLLPQNEWPDHTSSQIMPERTSSSSHGIAYVVRYSALPYVLILVY